MSFESLSGLVLCVFLLAYLLYALLNAEKL